MKASKHLKATKIKYVGTNGNEFFINVFDGRKEEMIKLETDPMNHRAWSAKKETVKGSESLKFKNKYKDLEI